MNRNAIYAALAIAVVMISGQGGANEPGNAESRSDIEMLRGRVVALTLMSDSEDLALLQDVTEKMLGERKFLVGKGVDDGDTPDWRNGTLVWIPMDDIQQIVAFDSLEHYRRNLEARPGRLEGKAAALFQGRPAGRRLMH